jgi:hypothetical protein
MTRSMRRRLTLTNSPLHRGHSRAPATSSWWKAPGYFSPRVFVSEYMACSTCAAGKTKALEPPMNIGNRPYPAYESVLRPAREKPSVH